MDVNKSLQKKIEELESKICFQDNTIETLNELVTNLQFEVVKLNKKLIHIYNKIDGESQSNIAELKDETPPPHY